MFPDLDTYTSAKLRKWSIRIVLLILLFIAIGWYLSNSWVYVSTDTKDATIELRRDTDVKKSSTKKSFFTAVEPGNYTLVVKTGNGASGKTLHLRHGGITITSLNATEARQANTIVTQSPVGISASAANMSFIESSHNTGIETYTSDGLYKRIAEQSSIVDIAWSSPTYGVVAYLDNTDGSDITPRIGIIDNGDIHQIQTPTDLTDAPYDLAIDSQKNIYLSIGSVLYKKTTSSDTFNRLYATDQKKTLSIASVEKRIVLYSYSTTEDDMVGDFFSLTLDGKERSPTTPASYTANPNFHPSAIQSPNGKHIAITENGVISLYDSDFKKEYELPAIQSSTSSLWVSDDMIAYTSGGSIYLYSLSEKTAKSIIYHNNDSYTQKELTIDQDKTYLYYQQIGSETSDSLMRVPLKTSSDRPSVDSVTLSKIFPYSIAVPMCRADVAFFGKPLVIISKLAEDSEVSQQENLSWCIEEVKDYLTKQKISLDSVSIATVIVDSLGEESIH